jgi:putative membrane protein
MFYMHDIGWGWWFVMSIGMVAFWAAVIYGLVWMLRGERKAERDELPSDSPEQILKRRLAQGEISIEQYERLRETIEPRPPDKLAA